MTHPFPPRRSSDLGIDRAAKRLGAARAIIFDLGDGAIWQAQRDRGGDARGPDVHRVEADRLPGGIDLRGFDASVGHRSEEHTSELQSLMRISYAVFCLKKKNHHTQ